jgi:hypothetical protein
MIDCTPTFYPVYFWRPLLIATILLHIHCLATEILYGRMEVNRRVRKVTRGEAASRFIRTTAISLASVSVVFL